MSYVIFNTKTEELYNQRPSQPRYFTTERGAKIVCTKLNKNELIWKVMSYKDYAAMPQPMVERINLMTGRKFMEPKNTPPHMSPAFEAYWSM
jgi:hypothetical protein